MNFGSDLGSGGSGGGLYKVNPYMQTFQAPLSDKGNSTASAGGGIDVKSPTQTFRLLDKNTGEVVYEGVGYEGAQEAINRASALTAEQGAKAQWQIQTPNSQQESGYSVVANEKRSQSTVGDIASFALPIAMAIATAGASLPAQMAAAGLAGAAGAGLAGKSPLKAGLISAATAGLGNVSGANEAIGKAVGSVGGTLLGKTAEEVAKQAAAEASGQIVVTGLSKALQGAGSGVLQSLVSGASNNLGGLTGYRTPAEQFAQQPLPEAFRPPADIYAGIDPINVLAGRSYLSPEALAAVMAGGVLPAATAGNVGAGSNVVDGVDRDTGEIVVNKYRPINPLGGLDPIAIAAATGLPIGSILESLGALNPPPADPALMQPETLPEDIVVDGSRIVRPEPEFVVPDIGLGIGSITESLSLPKADPKLTEKTTLEKIKDAVNIANAVSVLVPVAGGVLGGGGGGGTLSPDTTGLNFTTNPLRPTTPGTGIGGIGGRYPYTPTTYGRVGGDQETEYMFFTRDPVTGTPMAPVTAPAAPAMVAPSGNTFAEGGEVDDDMVKHLVDYHKNGGHQGPGQVKGIGSGQEDKIPAYLSDGEYVWSAQDVSDLGDGSNREGVRRLDKMRQMVRSQAGRKDVKKIAKPQKGIDRMLKAVGGMA
jgi:hypothetical protein